MCIRDSIYGDNPELLKYIDLLRQYKQGDAESNIGCIVMNCNPFTLGPVSYTHLVVPLNPSGTSKKIYVLAFIFLSVCIVIFWKLKN